MSRIDHVFARRAGAARHPVRQVGRKAYRYAARFLPVHKQGDAWWRSGLADLVDRPEAHRERAKRRVRYARKAIRRAQWETELEKTFGGAS